MIPDLKHGIDENFRNNLLYDFKSDDHKKVKYYK